MPKYIQIPYQQIATNSKIHQNTTNLPAFFFFSQLFFFTGVRVPQIKDSSKVAPFSKRALRPRAPPDTVWEDMIFGGGQIMAIECHWWEWTHWLCRYFNYCVFFFYFANSWLLQKHGQHWWRIGWSDFSYLVSNPVSKMVGALVFFASRGETSNWCRYLSSIQDPPVGWWWLWGFHYRYPISLADDHNPWRGTHSESLNLNQHVHGEHINTMSNIHEITMNENHSYISLRFPWTFNDIAPGRPRTCTGRWSGRSCCPRRPWWSRPPTRRSWKLHLGPRSSLSPTVPGERHQNFGILCWIVSVGSHELTKWDCLTKWVDIHIYIYTHTLKLSILKWTNMDAWP